MKKKLPIAQKGRIVTAIKDVGQKLADKVLQKKFFGDLNAKTRKDITKAVNESDRKAVKYNYQSKTQRDVRQEALDRRKALQQKQIDDSYKKRGGSIKHTKTLKKK